MEMIANILLIAGAFGAAFYCFVLQRRLLRFTQLENGMGSAIAVLSAQVDELTKALSSAQQASTATSKRLESLNGRADSAINRLELMLSALHDLPDPSEPETVIAQGRKLRFVRGRRPEAEAAE